MSENGDMPSSPQGHGSPDRKISKPLMEKRRRARINSCLTELKALLLTNADEKESGRFAKLEKADILEMTVKHLKSRQLNSVNENQKAMYRAGFNKCMDELSTFLGDDEEHSCNLRAEMISHLADILCSMERLNGTGTNPSAEKSKVLPGTHVSSNSNDDQPVVPNVAFPTSLIATPLCPSSTQPDAKAHSGSTRNDGFIPACGSKEVPPQQKVNTQSMIYSRMLQRDDCPTPAISSFSTIPVFPTVVTPGQVLLLLPNNLNGQIDIQIPTVTAGVLARLCHLGDASVATPQLSNEIPKSDRNLNSKNETKNSSVESAVTPCISPHLINNPHASLNCAASNCSTQIDSTPKCSPPTCTVIPVFKLSDNLICPPNNPTSTEQGEATSKNRSLNIPEGNGEVQDNAPDVVVSESKESDDTMWRPW